IMTPQNSGPRRWCEVRPLLDPKIPQTTRGAEAPLARAVGYFRVLGQAPRPPCRTRLRSPPDRGMGADRAERDAALDLRGRGGCRAPSARPGRCRYVGSTTLSVARFSLTVPLCAP